MTARKLKAPKARRVSPLREAKEGLARVHNVATSIAVMCETLFGVVEQVQARLGMPDEPAEAEADDEFDA